MKIMSAYVLYKSFGNPSCEMVVSFVSNLYKPLNPMARVNCHLSGLLFKYEKILNTSFTYMLLWR